MAAIEKGKTKEDFETDETSKADGRTLADQIADAGRAWAEAAKQIAAAIEKESGKSSKDKEEMARLVAEAKEAIQAGKSLDEFKNEQLWKKPKDEPESELVEKAKNAYRDAEL